MSRFGHLRPRESSQILSFVIVLLVFWVPSLHPGLWTKPCFHGYRIVFACSPTWWMTSSVGFPANIGSDWTDLLLLPSSCFLSTLQPQPRVHLRLFIVSSHVSEQLILLSKSKYPTLQNSNWGKDETKCKYISRL